MGRKSKPTVIISPVAGGTEVPPADGLPPFRRFLDIDGKQYGKKLLTRLFFVTPNEQEISATEKEQEHKSKTDTKIYVIAARMSWMGSGTDVSTPLFDYCQSVGFADDFSEDIVRLVVNRLKGIRAEPHRADPLIASCFQLWEELFFADGLASFWRRTTQGIGQKSNQSTLPLKG